MDLGKTITITAAVKQYAITQETEDLQAQTSLSFTLLPKIALV